VNIKAIETNYKGYRFRSRLEARWAVFFDHLRIKWEYEPEGYELPSGRYLPDFFLPHFSCKSGMFVEVKPTTLSDIENTKAKELAQLTHSHVLLAVGTRPPKTILCGVVRSGITPTPTNRLAFGTLTSPTAALRLSN